MSRRWFGGSVTDWTIGLGDEVTAGSGVTGPQALVQQGVPITFWSAQTGGTQYASLLDSTGVAISSVTSDAATGIIPRFQGPLNDDGQPEITYMWADAGSGRQLMVATDLGDAVAAMAAAVAANTASIAGLSNSPVFVYYNSALGSYPSRPSTGAPVWWVGPVAPVVGSGFAVAGLDFHFGPVTL